MTRLANPITVRARVASLRHVQTAGPVSALLARGPLAAGAPAVGGARAGHDLAGLRHLDDGGARHHCTSSSLPIRVSITMPSICPVLVSVAITSSTTRMPLGSYTPAP